MRRRVLLIAGWVLAAAAGALLVWRSPTALDREDRAAEVETLEATLAVTRDEGADLEALVQEAEEDRATLEERNERIRRQVRKQRREIRELEAQVAQLGG